MTIRRRPALLAAAAALTACGPVPTPVTAPPDAGTPSIVLISIDTLRADRVGCYGYERDTTPFLDRLAEEAIVFERALSPAPYTLVSHMSMLTGLHPRQHGVLGEGRALAPEFAPLAERLGDAGYRTAALFFPGWIDERFGFHRGFDVFRAHTDAEVAGEHFAEWLADVDRDEPYFLFLHLFDVHSAPLDGGTEPLYDPPAPFDRIFMADAPDRLAGLDRSDIWFEPSVLTADQLAAINAMYDGGVRYVDSKLEAWLGDLDDAGLMDEALVIVTSDHGESLGLRDGLLDGHGGVYQDGLHVPLVVRPPGGLDAQRRVARTVGTVDLAPTILAAAGVPDELLAGVDLLGEPSSEPIFNAQHAGFDVLVQWPWKLVLTEKHAAAFHLDLDPGERSPIGGALVENLEPRLEAAWTEWLGDSPPRVEPAATDGASPEERERLRQLGYLDEDE